MECLVKYLFQCFPTFANNNNNNSSCVLKDGGKQEAHNVKQDCNISNDANGKTSAVEAVTISEAGGGGEQAEQELDAPAETWWRCYLCNVKVAREETLNAHLQGKKHRRRLTNQISIVEEKGVGVGILEGKSPNVITRVLRTGDSAWICEKCHATCSCKENLVDHLLGQKHATIVSTKVIASQLFSLM